MIQLLIKLYLFLQSKKFHQILHFLLSIWKLTTHIRYNLSIQNLSMTCLTTIFKNKYSKSKYDQILFWS